MRYHLRESSAEVLGISGLLMSLRHRSAGFFLRSWS